MLTTAYARTEITLLVVLGGLATAAVGYFFHWWGLLPAVLALALLSFYRHPRRPPPPGDNLLLSPADGRIVEITPDAEHPDSDGRVLRIMVFLAVYNVHVNRSPCAGRVTSVTYRPGRFLNALRAEADTSNECNTVVLDPAAPLVGPIRVRQIAGVLARRIVCTAQVDDELAAAQAFGMIKLGSRTEVCVPADARWEVAVSIGDKVRAGQTILARWVPSR